ncbi:IS1249 family transposase [Microbacterium sp. NPDC087589]|uniref:IS1249 family transposase n=1 Tax=Microbacterium sp. NPDC087589 TaxID=3364191 RepID=UPI00382DD883
MVCGARLVKNGRHRSGTQRWRCPGCGASSVRRRPDVTRREQLSRFVKWLTGKQTQAEIDGTTTGRSFRRDTAWCWDVEPQLEPATAIFHAVLVDGVWIGDYCLLIALSDKGNVLAWQWSGGESVAAWKALLNQVEAPGILVSDGGTGLPTALAACWPETKHQRCLFHLQMNVSRHLTRNPRTDAGRALRALVMRLSEVQNEDAAIAWQLKLEKWWQTFGHLTRERTLFRNGQWGFTHDRLRKAWMLIRRVSRNDTLFTWITYGNPRTTSPLEGGINAQIREILRRHRGMSEEHRRRAVEWFLVLHELPLERALSLARTKPEPEPDTEPDEPHGPALYDTGLDAGEGLWLRTGWAGRG